MEAHGRDSRESGLVGAGLTGIKIDGIVPSVSSPTIVDVAARAGVSKSSVSRVLRGSPLVSEEARAAVLSAIE